ncbi:DUF3883 domain-containing protein [Lysobacter sp. Root559]|uniref:sacsin N-terminal ATP-binding-like domain-containing protein n=1 Tax=Lysobacter sp. Root559 TaxID=1736559 RepID=UPI0009E7E874|nr:DUF3883 domain-containing protein [Lysobacter sp. Root559]
MVISKQRELIERIRKEKFGIGVELHGDARTLFDNAISWIRNLLKIVAEDLYSKESHFVLELVQNADDNSYKPGVYPSLSFRIETDCLVVVNNECGFEEKNIKALCSAGESSKSNDKAGYIGEKGIGFKSIFKVTDSPQIHSNGFHFRFDRSDSHDLLGYVVPHWHEPTLKLDENSTTLVIPAKPDHVFSSETLRSLSDPLLLFLRKLRHLEVSTPEWTSSYKRVDKGSITTLVTTKSGLDPVRQDYLRKTIAIDMSPIKEPKREGIKETEIVLAFPMGKSGEAQPMPGCATYAFLPIRDFGFNFYIQADFVLVSSREGIHEDQPWNIRLRDAIADAFIQSIEEFKKQPALAMTFLKYLPSKEEVHDPFFSPIVTQIIRKLKDVACIPVASGGWRKPAESLVASDQIRRLLPSKDAIEIFGADYVNDEFILSSQLMTQLGCRKLQVAEVVALFSKHSCWLKEKGVDWLANLYAYFALSQNRSDFVEQLLKVACIPVDGRRMTIPANDMVFFPLDSSKKYGFEDEIDIIDNDLLGRARAVFPAIDAFFGELDVRHDNPLELIQAHILPRHQGEAWKSGSHEALVGHIRYIKDRFSKYLQLAAAGGQVEAAAITVLRDGLWVGTKKEDGAWTFGRANNLYFSTEYQPEFDIETLLGSEAPKEKFVSPRYLRMPQKNSNEGVCEEELTAWREFMVRLGVNLSPRVIRETSGNVTCSSELELLLNSGVATVRREVLQVLDRNWSQYPANTTYSVGSGRHQKPYYTNLVSSLRSSLAPSRKKGNIILSAAYVGNEEVRGVLGDSVAYLDVDLSNAEFLDACGVTYKLDAAACLKRLRQMKSDDVRSTDQVKKIYRRLETLWEKERFTIEAAFAADKLIRIGKGDAAKWVSPSEACWNPTNVDFLDSRYPPLSGPYREYQTFFTKRLNVPGELSLQNWVDALKEVDDVGVEGRERAILLIYRRLGRALDNHRRAGGEFFEVDWLSDLDTYSLLLNKRGEMVGKSEHFYADDRPEISTLFEDVEAVSFFFAQPAQLHSLATLLDALGIKRVSEVISIEVVQDVQGRLNSSLTEKLRTMLVPIARVAYNQSHARFESLIKDGSFGLLNRVEVTEVDSLVLSVSLGHWTSETYGRSAIREHEILLDTAAPSHIDHVAIEVEKLLGLNGASDAISRLLMSESKAAANDYLEVRKISDIPEDDFSKLMESIGQIQAAGAAPSKSPCTEQIEPADIEADEDTLEEQEYSDGHTTASTEGVTDKAQRPKPESNPGSPDLEPILQDAYRASSNSAQAERGVGAPSPGSVPVQNVHRSGISASRDAWGESMSPHKFSYDKNHNKRKPSTESGHLISYVMPKRSTNEIAAAQKPENPAQVEHKKKVEEAAVAFFMKTAAGKWKDVEIMPPFNHGFDIKAVSMEGHDEFIEVKGQGSAWTEAGVALTPKELLTASEKRERYWLCIVEHALDESRRRLWLVNDPFGQANQFRFDRGWQVVATASEGAPMRPEVGLFISTPDKGRGKIVRVMGGGSLHKVTFVRDKNNPATVVFNPSTMKLSHN